MPRKGTERDSQHFEAAGRAMADQMVEILKSGVTRILHGLSSYEMYKDGKDFCFVTQTSAVIARQQQLRDAMTSAGVSFQEERREGGVNIIRIPQNSLRALSPKVMEELQGLTDGIAALKGKSGNSLGKAEVTMAHSNQRIPGEYKVVMGMIEGKIDKPRSVPELSTFTPRPQNVSTNVVPTSRKEGVLRVFAHKPAPDGGGLPRFVYSSESRIQDFFRHGGIDIIVSLMGENCREFCEAIRDNPTAKAELTLPRPADGRLEFIHFSYNPKERRGFSLEFSPDAFYYAGINNDINLSSRPGVDMQRYGELQKIASTSKGKK